MSAIADAATARLVVAHYRDLGVVDLCHSALYAPWPLSAQMPRSGAGRFRLVGPPRLNAVRIPAHHNRVGEPTAALGAAEAQILQRAIALAGVDDRLQIGGRL